MAKAATSREISIRSLDDAIAALERVDAIQEQIDPLMREATDLKRAATQFAVSKKLDTIQLDGHYYRHIQRYNKLWDAEVLKRIVKGKFVKFRGKKTPLWQLVTKRIPDPELIQEAVAQGWVKEKEVALAFVEKPQSPFLQKFQGFADDGE